MTNNTVWHNSYANLHEMLELSNLLSGSGIHFSMTGSMFVMLVTEKYSPTLFPTWLAWGLAGWLAEWLGWPGTYWPAGTKIHTLLTRRGWVKMNLCHA